MKAKKDIKSIIQEEGNRLRQLNDHKISLENVFEEFNSHFEDDRNTNILFTGRYGIGKTYFLYEYFEQESIREKYNSILISPVNYIVSSNENIFDLIKVDIIRQLFDKSYVDYAEDIKYDKLFSTLSYTLTKPIELLKNLTTSLSKTSVEMEVASEAVKGVDAFVKSFSKFEKHLNETLKTKPKKAEEFSKAFENVSGTFIENNIITQIIRTSLSDLKSQDKKNVLIIDDLDRLDPEHIFRILNILSAHNNNGENKFGFDKIIIVCDIDNIQKIFKHFYGPLTDFSGYIDKFYSIKPYAFTNYEAIHFFLFDKLKINLPSESLIVTSRILSFFVNRGELNLRKIFKTDFYVKGDNKKMVMSVNLELPKFSDRPHHIQTNTLKIFEDDFKILDVFRILELVFGDISLKRAFVKLQKDNYGKIHKEVAESFLNVMALASRVLQYGNSCSVFTNSIQNYDYPRGNICGYNYRIVCQFNNGNPYKGDRSYFFDSTTHFLDANEYVAKIDDIPFTTYFEKILSFYEYYKKQL